MFERLNERTGGVETGEASDVRLDRCAADSVPVGNFTRALRVVDNEVDRALPDDVEHVRRTAGNLMHFFARNSRSFQRSARSGRCQQFMSQGGVAPQYRN